MHVLSTYDPPVQSCQNSKERNNPPKYTRHIYINEHSLTPERKPAIKYSGQKVNKTKTDNHHFSPGIHQTMIGRKIF